jgi:hypothetical protein
MNTCTDACNSALASGAGMALDSLEPLLVDSRSRPTTLPALRLVIKWANGGIS